MVKHIVMWKLLDTANGQSKQENINQMKAMLEALPTKIEEIDFTLEVGQDYVRSERSFDLALVSDFASDEDLNCYRVHPEHQKVVKFVHSVVEKSVAVDYQY